MDAVLKVIGIVSAIWLAASFIVAIGWWLIASKVGPRPVPDNSHLRMVYDVEQGDATADVYDVERDGGL
jgi:hypothetical protein